MNSKPTIKGVQSIVLSREAYGADDQASGKSSDGVELADKTPDENVPHNITESHIYTGAISPTEGPRVVPIEADGQLADGLDSEAQQ